VGKYVRRPQEVIATQLTREMALGLHLPPNEVYVFGGEFRHDDYDHTFSAVIGDWWVESPLGRGEFMTDYMFKQVYQRAQD
jgi:hypothetical protein